MRTYSAKLRVMGRSFVGRTARTLIPIFERRRLTDRFHASEAGDTLIEVLISALLIGLIVVSTLTGFNVTSNASATERARAQADALAQQAEERLRSLSLAKLETLQVEPRVEEVTQNGTKYTITSTAEYRTDETSTSSCNSTSTNAGYFRTSSTVTGAWQSAKNPVVETGIISPPPGSALIVQVTNAASEGVAGMTVTATGPAPTVAPHTLSTATNGCAILSLLPGEYAINVSQPGYVDENWYTESKKDLHATRSVYLTAESSVKEPYRFDRAGSLEVKFTTESAPSEGDSFVAFNPLMTPPAFRSIPSPASLGTYATKIKSSTTVFPFPEKAPYSVYAGTCEANNPQTVNPANGAPPTAFVLPGKTGSAEVVQPPINIRVMSGTKAGAATEGLKVENATGTLVEPAEPAGCGVTRKFTTTKEGALLHPGMPFSEYTLCVTGGKAGGVGKEEGKEIKGLAKERRYVTSLFENGTAAGPTEAELAKIANGGVVKESGKNVAVIYMGVGASEPVGGELKPGTEC